MMKSRKLAIGLLLMLAMVVTTGSFAYWASGLGGANDNIVSTVTIGEGEEESSTITFGALSSTGSALVPTSAGTAGGDDTATFTAPVSWDQDSGTEFAGDTGTLVVSVEYALHLSLYENSYTHAELDEMFSYTVTGDGAIIEGAAAQNVVVTIVFDTEPGSETIYNDIITETLYVTITYTVITN